MPIFPTSPQRKAFPIGHVPQSNSAPVSPSRMDSPRVKDEGYDIEHSHNPSLQHNVIQNDDPALDQIHEHHHAHIHHSAHAEEGREDEVVYSNGTTFEKSNIPHQDPQDHDLHRRKHAEITNEKSVLEKSVQGSQDPERGSTFVTLGQVRSEDDPQTHTGSTFYQKYRIFFHLAIWIFFTA